jgi:nicotinate-nucleotide adenylyltransferase
MRLAILGGSFNPVHLGHLYLADAVLSGFGYGRVIFIPAFQSPFKLGAPAPSPKDRLDMLAASIPGDPRLLIDDCEIRREGVSYTVDTLADIIRRYRPEGKPGLILGDDLGRDFPKWKDFEKIISLADIIIARRILSEAGEYPYPCVQMQNDVMQISSAQVRDLIAQGKHWHYLVPAGARIIIQDRELYGYTAGPAAKSAGPVFIARMEEEARRRLSQPRFLHSRQVAVMTSDLCRIFGLDSQAGYLAGITHDIGKQLGEEELVKLAKSDKRAISVQEKRKPSLLHGRAGAALLKKEYGIRDQEILDAVAFHTTGSPAMGPLAKAVYIADKVESSREGVEPRLRDFSEYEGTGDRGLDRLFGKILRETIAWLRVKNIEPTADALRLLAKLEGGSPR